MSGGNTGHEPGLHCQDVTPATRDWNMIVPPWLEILLDFSGYAGFIGLAVWHRPSCDESKDARS